MTIVNIVARSLVALVGIGIAFGLGPAEGAPSPFHEIFGTVVFLFGTYRLITYINARNAT
ncbi:MAG: hypothetical protein EHM43_03660 [Ignavibacteriae bacterium]|nr:MAG: hypothetical protein EHM43_03660 [Ignavibacteriota bacterium]